MPISISKDQIPLSQARQNLSQLVDDIEAGLKPGASILKDGQSKVVMIATETYEQLLWDREKLMDALNTATDLEQGLRDYRAGKTLSEKKFMAALTRKYGGK